MKKYSVLHTGWCKPANPTLKEAEARCGEFQASLVYIKRYYLQKKTNNIQPQ
jgi:hypothetical protein